MHDEVKNEDIQQEEYPLPDEPVVDTSIAEGTGNVNEEFENLRRWGFQYAISKRVDGNPTSDELLEIHREKQSRELKRWEQLYSHIIERYEDKIKKLKSEIEDIKTPKLLPDPTLNELEVKKNDLKEEMKDLKERIKEVRRKLVEAKDDMAGKRMRDAEIQIDQAIGVQAKLDEQERERNKKLYADSKLTFEKQIASWSEKRLKLKEQQNEVQERMIQIGADGVSPATANLLIAIGTSVAAACGYFFSVFTGNSNFSSNDAFYFLLNGFLEAGKQEQPTFMVKIFYYVGFLFVIGIISFLCYKLFKKFFGARHSAKEDFMKMGARGKLFNDSNEASAEIKAGSWFSLWLQIMPLVIILGVTVLLLAINKGATGDVSRLNSSVEGLLTGSAIALGIGGIMCLYIMKIVEPRLHRRQKETAGVLNWIRFNWELAGCILLFLLATITIVVYPLKDAQLSGHNINAIAIPEFIAISLLAAFPFAYGIRFKGLISVNHYLHRQTDYLDRLIAAYSSPVAVEAEQPLVDDTVAIIHYKGRLLMQQVSGQKSPPVLPASQAEERNPAWFKKLLNGLFNKLKETFSREKNTENAINQLAKLEEWERLYFPGLDEEIKLLAFEYREKDEEYKEVKNNIDKLKADTDIDQDEKLQKINRLNKHIETLYTYIRKTETAAAKRFIQAGISFSKAEVAILDGFHLGTWYRYNQLGPVDDFYQPISANGQSGNSGQFMVKLLGNGNE